MLHQITAAMLNALYAELAGPTNDRRELSEKTVSYIHAIVHRVLADAVDADLLARNAAERAKPPRPNRRSTVGIRAWDAEELSQAKELPPSSRWLAVRRNLASCRDDGYAAPGGPRSQVEGSRPWSSTTVRPSGTRSRGVFGHSVDPAEPHRPRNRPRR